jgi:putative ABC transport system permease protein
LITTIRKIDGVKTVEGWNYSSTSLVKNSAYEVTRTYPDKGHGSFIMQAMPIPTKLLSLTVTEGRWLYSEESDDVVLNQLARTPDMKIGDMISLALDGRETKWRITGFTEDVGTPATAYVSLTTFSKLAGTAGKIKKLCISYSDRSQESAIVKNKKVEELLEHDKIGVSSTMPVWMLQNAVAAHMRVLVNSLLAMAVLMALVGTLGLMSTVSMNVLERTREIGVMRALGATPSKIKNLIVWEGLTIGVLSILVAFVVSLALSYFMGEFIGHISFRTPLSLTISLLALVIWIGIIIAGSYLATLYPARRANKVTTREALAYE